MKKSKFYQTVGCLFSAGEHKLALALVGKYIDIKSVSKTGHVKLSNGDEVFPSRGTWWATYKKSGYTGRLVGKTFSEAMEQYQERQGHAITNIDEYVADDGNLKVKGTVVKAAAPKWHLKDVKSGKWASYDMGRGPYLTDNDNLRYCWDDEKRAEQQKALYERALKTKLEVVKAMVVVAKVWRIEDVMKMDKRLDKTDAYEVLKTAGKERPKGITCDHLKRVIDEYLK